jgi:hypothetical protein
VYAVIRHRLTGFFALILAENGPMKKSFLFIFLLMAAIGLHAQGKTIKSVKNIEKMVRFTNADYHMGKIPAGKPVEYTVKVTNISRDTFAIQHVMPGCGCTTPKYTSGEKLLPGRSTTIVLGFNGNAHGKFTKSADIIFSNGMVKQVKFSGEAR